MMKREFTIRPAKWPAENQEWELVFTTVLSKHVSTSNVETVSLAYMREMYYRIGEFLHSDQANQPPVRHAPKIRTAQNV